MAYWETETDGIGDLGPHLGPASGSHGPGRLASATAPTHWGALVSFQGNQNGIKHRHFIAG